MAPAFSYFPLKVKNIWPKRLHRPTSTIKNRSYPEAGKQVWPNIKAAVKASEKPMKPNQETVTDQWISGIVSTNYGWKYTEEGKK